MVRFLLHSASVGIILVQAFLICKGTTVENSIGILAHVKLLTTALVNIRCYVGTTVILHTYYIRYKMCMALRYEVLVLALEVPGSIFENNETTFVPISIFRGIWKRLWPRLISI